MKIFLLFVSLSLAASTCNTPPSGVSVQPSSPNAIIIFQSAEQQCPVIANVASYSSITADIKSNLSPIPYQNKPTHETAPSQRVDDTIDNVTLQRLFSCKTPALILQAYVTLLAPYSVAVTFMFLTTLLLGVNGRDMRHYWLDGMGIVGMVMFYSLWRRNRR